PPCRPESSLFPYTTLFRSRRRVNGKALVAAAALALGARKRIFLVRLGMQEHRKILADGLEALADHLFGRGADDHVVLVLHRQARSEEHTSELQSRVDLVCR